MTDSSLNPENVKNLCLEDDGALTHHPVSLSHQGTRIWTPYL